LVTNGVGWMGRNRVEWYGVIGVGLRYVLGWIEWNWMVSGVNEMSSVYQSLVEVSVCLSALSVCLSVFRRQFIACQPSAVDDG